ncbi:uncharacterized protein [Pocillopora verrucosa]|uniref:uncharacterized protein n=1 Tax=Pocillopora verrucosa TaxID=203993 RepID=UPI00333F3500
MAEIHDAMELLRIEVERGKKTQERKIERGGEEKGREADRRTETEKCYNCGAVGHIRAQCRRPRGRDRKEYKRDSDVVVFITTFTALSKILKLLNKECFKCEMSDSASFLNSHGKG